ncbi:hypothetical protein [Veillonella sp. VA139]|uniref:hypothetical protein n=1 Tax=Veillonella sp. VA139 TaxID=741830 RepID=UPI000F8E6BFB|nr:hypothetical protein [Veillonella sp. VA139]
MEPVTTPMEKRIRMVRAWLDAAAKSYATKGSVKGNFHLFLAQAEMKQMNEGKPSIVSYAQRAVVVFALVGIIGATHWWLSQHETGNTAHTPVIDTQVEVQPSKVSTPVVVKESPPVEQAETNVVETVIEQNHVVTTRPTVEATPEPSISSKDMLHAVQAGGRILRD